VSFTFTIVRRPNSRAFKEINSFERQLKDFGMILAKFWIHISQEEQFRRFEERKAIGYKAWKLTEEDWRNRQKWSVYEEAVEEMLVKTSTKTAPWNLVEGNDKYWARVKVAIETRGDPLGGTWLPTGGPAEAKIRDESRQAGHRR
jgi:polyphosphate kinase 2 (PPK2 family)